MHEKKVRERIRGQQLCNEKLQETVGTDLKDSGFHFRQLRKGKNIFKKGEKIELTTRSNNSTSGYIAKRTEHRDSERDLYTHVHSGIIHKS